MVASLKPQTLALCSILLSTASPVLACSPSELPTTTAEIRRSAQQHYAGAEAVVDVEVVMPMDLTPREGSLPVAGVQLIHSWKGEAPEVLFPLFVLDSCDLAFPVKGQKFRLLLERGDRIVASTIANGLAASDQSKFDAEIDRLIGVVRPSEFSSIRENATPPKKHSMTQGIAANPSPFLDRAVQIALVLAVFGSSLGTWAIGRLLAPKRK